MIRAITNCHVIGKDRLDNLVTVRIPILVFTHFSEATLATPANHQQFGAGQPGDQAPHAGGAHLP